MTSLPKWREALALARRAPPELYQRGDPIDAGPHSDAIRFALEEVGVSAVFCIGQVPTIAILSVGQLSVDEVDVIHRALWNQGLMSLLLVASKDELAAYSLVQRPFRREGQLGPEVEDPRLIETFSLVGDALELRQLIRSAESGRLWIKHEAFFDPAERIDSILLDNLIQAYRELQGSLGPEEAQALLMQTMFVAYLEDRGVIEADVFRAVSGGVCSTFGEILAAPDTNSFEALFDWLKDAFNGDIFNAPCAFDLKGRHPPRVKKTHLAVLARFRHGREEMITRQLRFFGYDFKYIPVALISAVYDRFLKEEADRRSAEGAYYTPMFLADTVVNQIWSALSDDQKESGIFADPACGSGVFLVRIFERLVADRRRNTTESHLPWETLVSIARRLHGGDINAAAVRVTSKPVQITQRCSVNH